MTQPRFHIFLALAEDHQICPHPPGRARGACPNGARRACALSRACPEPPWVLVSASTFGIGPILLGTVRQSQPLAKAILSEPRRRRRLRLHHRRATKVIQGYRGFEIGPDAFFEIMFWSGVTKPSCHAAGRRSLPPRRACALSRACPEPPWSLCSASPAGVGPALGQRSGQANCQGHPFGAQASSNIQDDTIE